MQQPFFIASLSLGWGFGEWDGWGSGFTHLSSRYSTSATTWTDTITKIHSVLLNGCKKDTRVLDRDGFFSSIVMPWYLNGFENSMYSARSGLMVSGATIMLNESPRLVGTVAVPLPFPQRLLGTFVDQLPDEARPLLAQRHGPRAVPQDVVPELAVGGQGQVVGEVDPLGQLDQQVDAVAPAAELVGCRRRGGKVR